MHRPRCGSWNGEARTTNPPSFGEVSLILQRPPLPWVAIRIRRIALGDALAFASGQCHRNQDQDQQASRQRAAAAQSKSLQSRAGASWEICSSPEGSKFRFWRGRNSHGEQFRALKINSPNRGLPWVCPNGGTIMAALGRVGNGLGSRTEATAGTVNVWCLCNGARHVLGHPGISFGSDGLVVCVYLVRGPVCGSCETHVPIVAPTETRPPMTPATCAGKASIT